MKNYEQSLEDLIREALPDIVVTNFVFVAEIMTENGTNLYISMSDNMTPWLAQGMLQCGMELVADSGEYDDDE